MGQAIAYIFISHYQNPVIITQCCVWIGKLLAPIAVDINWSDMFGKQLGKL